MSTSIIQLLCAGVFVALWYRFYLNQDAKAKREAESRRQTIDEGRDSLVEEPKPTPILVESEPVPAMDAEFESNEVAVQEEPMRTPTGVVCIVRKARRRLRCTEFEVDGKLQTEVCRVNKQGRAIGKPAYHAGAYRDVTDALLNLKAA